MNESDKKLIKETIAPVVQKGDAALILGAGFSQGTLAINQKNIPSSNDLIQRIIEKTNYDGKEASQIDLGTAFTAGQHKINDFDNFLKETFDCKIPFAWQLIPLKHWWRKIYTTNIDTVLNKALDHVRESKNEEASNSADYFKIYNYRDRRPAVPEPLEMPIVHLHGTINQIKSGFVFGDTEYADYIIKGGDWLNDVGLNINHGHCIFIGSRFKEQDIEVELQKRTLWDETEGCSIPNWIVKPSFLQIEIDAYDNRNLIPIKATAEEFLLYLDSCLTKQSATKYIKRLMPHLLEINNDNSAASWLGTAFEHVPTIVNEKKALNGLYSRFFTGDPPDWFYISHEVPAKFDFVDDIVLKIKAFGEKKDIKNVFYCVFTGQVACGKTTASMIVLKELARFNNSVYSFKSNDGIDVDKLWRAIKNVKGLLVLHFDKSSEHFYAIKNLSDKVIKQSVGLKVAFVIEERERSFAKNKHQLFSDIEKADIEFHVPKLSHKNASSLIDALNKNGLTGGGIKELDNDQAIQLILDKEKGYRGDILATLCDVVSNKPFWRKLDDDFKEITNVNAIKIFKFLCITSAARMYLPVEYVAEMQGLKVSSIFKLLKTHLSGKIYINDDCSMLSSRHQVIAEYYLDKTLTGPEKRDFIVDLMKCVSKKYKVEDIRYHPLPYRIYKALLSNSYLRFVVFKNEPNEIENIYSLCQTLFPQDAIFWLQYGKFLHKESRLDEALHCIRKGYDIYDSFQIRHALGHVILDKYVEDNFVDDELFNEGVELLEYDLTTRPEDPYPYNTLAQCLLNILEAQFNDGVLEKLKEVINSGLKIHRNDSSFQRTVTRYIKNGYSA